MTFDRPVQTSTFTAGQVVSIQGPKGSVLGPQTFGSTSIDQQIDPATTAGPGTLDSTLTVNSDITLQIADITVHSPSERRWIRVHGRPDFATNGHSRTGTRSVVLGRGWCQQSGDLLTRSSTTRPKIDHPGQGPIHGNLHA